jgi:4-hydroxy-tetrahydrodipicolinate synthase
MFRGAYTALVTPFAADGSLDEACLRTLVNRQIAEGIDGLVPTGTTGECPTLAHPEHDRVIEVTVEASAKRVPVIAGTGSNSTAEALRLTRHAKQAGADGALVVSPYYNRPTQEGLYRHFMAVAEIGLPVVLYNIPSRCGVTIEVPTLVRLARHPKIVAIKEATGSLDFASQVAAETPLALLSGDDSLTLPIGAVGGVGVISVLANLMPRRVKELIAAIAAGDFATARRIHLATLELFKIMFIETNPGPIKAAMALAGLCRADVRLPMAPMSEANLARLAECLTKHKIV